MAGEMSGLPHGQSTANQRQREGGCDAKTLTTSAANVAIGLARPSMGVIRNGDRIPKRSIPGPAAIMLRFPGCPKFVQDKVLLRPVNDMEIGRAPSCEWAPVHI